MRKIQISTGLFCAGNNFFPTRPIRRKIYIDQCEISRRIPMQIVNGGEKVLSGACGGFLGRIFRDSYDNVLSRDRDVRVCGPAAAFTRLFDRTAVAREGAIQMQISVTL